MAIVKMSQSNEEWLASSEPPSIEANATEQADRPFHGHMRNRHFVKLNSFQEKVVRAQLETSALLRRAEEEMHQYAWSRLRRVS
jgi:hypothetical protein